MDVSEVMGTVPADDRFVRQADLVPRGVLKCTDAIVIGVGAIGRQVAQSLAVMGCPRLILVDPDVVEDVNVATQGYFFGDIGKPKVEATALFLHSAGNSLPSPGNEDGWSPLEVFYHQKRFVRQVYVDHIRRGHNLAVFSCVDSMASRRDIAKYIMYEGDNEISDILPHVFIDGRMQGEVMRVLAFGASDRSPWHDYVDTIVPDAEAVQGSCTAAGTFYAASIIGGLMLHQFARWLRTTPLDFDRTMILTSGEFINTPATGWGEE